jgi:hypothetical protein
LSIEDLQFDLARQRIRDERDVSDEIEWAVFGQRVLREGSLTPIEEIFPAAVLPRPCSDGGRLSSLAARTTA